MTTRAKPKCLSCKHLTSVQYAKRACKAYPKGIPDAIWLNDHDHTKPYRGDGGIQYEPKK
jgi:hypothetical protein